MLEYVWTKQKIAEEIGKLRELNDDYEKMDRIFEIAKLVFRERNNGDFGYGGSWKSKGLVGIFTVLDNKISRGMKINPSKTEAVVPPQNAPDTLMDVICYAAMGEISYQEDVIE